MLGGAGVLDGARPGAHKRWITAYGLRMGQPHGPNAIPGAGMERSGACSPAGCGFPESWSAYALGGPESSRATVVPDSRADLVKIRKKIGRCGFVKKIRARRNREARNFLQARRGRRSKRCAAGGNRFGLFRQRPEGVLYFRAEDVFQRLGDSLTRLKDKGPEKIPARPVAGGGKIRWAHRRDGREIGLFSNSAKMAPGCRASTSVGPLRNELQKEWGARCCFRRHSASVLFEVFGTRAREPAGADQVSSRPTPAVRERGGSIKEQAGSRRGIAGRAGRKFRASVRERGASSFEGTRSSAALQGRGLS